MATDTGSRWSSRFTVGPARATSAGQGWKLIGDGWGMKTLLETGSGDQRFILEEEDGVLFESNNATTRATVEPSAFAGWGLRGDMRADSKWIGQLARQFKSGKLAVRYWIAACGI